MDVDKTPGNQSNLLLEDKNDATPSSGRSSIDIHPNLSLWRVRDS